jgi:hypothetical protein
VTALDDLRAAASVDTARCIRWERSLAGNGYGMVRAGRMRGAHVVVCEWTYGPRPDGTEVAHICGVRCCVNPKHLRWATHVDNAADRHVHGTHRTGERSPNAVLTADAVRAARVRHAAGETFTALGREYGVSRTAMRNAIVGRTWADVR